MLNLDEGITVLSLFDGMACGRIALERAGIKVKAYYASEIDKPAMKVAKHNWPDIIHIGDVTKVFYFNGWLYTENGDFYVGKIDLLIGGSPCQGFSFAGKQLNFNDPRSKLFFEFVRLRKETECEYFFLENVVMKQEFQNVISEHLDVKPIFINSALVSAQNRKRLYWTNISFLSEIQDKNILLKDILLDNFSPFVEDKSLCISAGYRNNPGLRDYAKSQKQLICKDLSKYHMTERQIALLKECATTDKLIKIIYHRERFRRSLQTFDPNGKTECLDTCQGGGRGYMF